MVTYTAYNIHQLGWSKVSKSNLQSFIISNEKKIWWASTLLHNREQTYSIMINTQWVWRKHLVVWASLNLMFHVRICLFLGKKIENEGSGRRKKVSLQTLKNMFLYAKENRIKNDFHKRIQQKDIFRKEKTKKKHFHDDDTSCFLVLRYRDGFSLV